MINRREFLKLTASAAFCAALPKMPTHPNHLYEIVQVPLRNPNNCPLYDLVVNGTVIRAAVLFPTAKDETVAQMTQGDLYREIHLWNNGHIFTEWFSFDDVLEQARAFQEFEPDL